VDLKVETAAGGVSEVADLADLLARVTVSPVWTSTLRSVRTRW